MHPEPYRTYNIDRNINYTNICTAVCDFCAFYRKPKSDEGYVLPREELLEKVAKPSRWAATRSCCRAGCIPSYRLEWYEEMLGDIKRDFPQVNVHGFSPPELHHFTKVNKLPLKTVLRAAEGGRAWAAFRAAEPRSWSIACDARSRAERC